MERTKLITAPRAANLRMASLRRIAEQYQASAASQGAAGPGGAALEESPEADDDAVPELVEAVSCDSS